MLVQFLINKEMFGLAVDSKRWIKEVQDNEKRWRNFYVILFFHIFLISNLLYFFNHPTFWSTPRHFSGIIIS